MDDAGTIINPLLAAGQIHGGVVQGIGQVLYEEVCYDGDSGRLLTGSLLDYAAPRADSIPAIRSQFQETPSPTNPLGVKGIGESGSIGAPPTIVHAVLDALAPFGIASLRRAWWHRYAADERNAHLVRAELLHAGEIGVRIRHGRRGPANP